MLWRYRLRVKKKGGAPVCRAGQGRSERPAARRPPAAFSQFRSDCEARQTRSAMAERGISDANSMPMSEAALSKPVSNGEKVSLTLIVPRVIEKKLRV